MDELADLGGIFQFAGGHGRSKAWGGLWTGQGHTARWTPRGNPDTLTHCLLVVTERSGGMDSEGRGPGLRGPALHVDWPLGCGLPGEGKGRALKRERPGGAAFGNCC